jgi:hypothetical protein
VGIICSNSGPLARQPVVRPAVVGEFITAVAGDRVRFVPFVSGANFLEVGLLYR